MHAWRVDPHPQEPGLRPPRHTSVGLKYLPPIARRLHHCRDLADAQPLDFLTWFDYSPEHPKAFEDLVGALRSTEEWRYVDREVDIGLSR